MQSIHSTSAPEAIGTYSQAIKCDNTVYLSGQIPLDPKTMKLSSEDIKLQIHQVLENLSSVCQAAGGTLAHIAKLNVYLIDMDHFPIVNEVVRHYFTEPFPARAAIGVASLPRGAQIEIDGIMVLSKVNS
jgi:reactive intermediate/imine deaminase